MKSIYMAVSMALLLGLIVTYCDSNSSQVIDESESSMIDPKTGIKFPNQLAKTPFRQSLDLEKKIKGLGKAYIYQNNSVAIQIFIYNKGLSFIPEGVNSTIKRYYNSEKKAIKLAVKKEIFDSIKLKKEQVIKINGLAFLHAKYELKKQDEKTILHILITGYKGQIFKVIISTYTNTFSKKIMAWLKKDLATILNKAKQMTIG